MKICSYICKYFYSEGSLPAPEESYILISYICTLFFYVFISLSVFLSFFVPLFCLSLPFPPLPISLSLSLVPSYYYKNFIAKMLDITPQLSSCLNRSAVASEFLSSKQTVELSKLNYCLYRV
jgi:hypothetical protein